VDAEKINHIGIVGAGAWGTALAQAAALAGRRVTLLANRAELADEINLHHRYARFLPGRSLLPQIEAVAEPALLGGCDGLLVACPAQALRTVLGSMGRVRVPAAICAKGMESQTGLLMHEVARAVQPDGLFGLLSGPGFADEIVQGLPCAVTIAFDALPLAGRFCEALGSGIFRPYASSDMNGVAIGGAVKNVLAIACGVVEGRGLGESARAAVMTRGFAEMARFGQVLGARLETMTGLSGFGDLVLTASSRQSRNFALGVHLARGERSTGRAPLAEGAATAPALVRRAKAAGIQMPIAEAVAGIVSGDIDVDTAIRALLSRPLKSEH
jgi:glycerol-3-phosphate dehydrogenase (NAD(P)+)